MQHKINAVAAERRFDGDVRPVCHFVVLQFTTAGWQFRLFRKGEIRLRCLIQQYSGNDGDTIEEHEGEVEGQVVIVRKGYRNFAVSWSF